MFDTPSNDDIEKCIVTNETVEKNCSPQLIINESKKSNKKLPVKKSKVKKESVS